MSNIFDFAQTWWLCILDLDDYFLVQFFIISRAFWCCLAILAIIGVFAIILTFYTVFNVIKCEVSPFFRKKSFLPFLSSFLYMVDLCNIWVHFCFTVCCTLCDKTIFSRGSVPRQIITCLKSKWLRIKRQKWFIHTRQKSKRISILLFSFSDSTSISNNACNDFNPNVSSSYLLVWETSLQWWDRQYFYRRWC